MDDERAKLELISEPRPLLLALVLGGLIWVFLGFFVYWLRTGETTVIGGTVSSLGSAVWFAPLPVGLAVWALGPIGPLRVLWSPTTVVVVDRSGMRWWVGDGPQSTLSWDDVGGISAERSSIATITTVFDRSGTPLQELQGAFRFRVLFGYTELGWACARVRPDLFERVGGLMSTYRGCVRRDAERA